MQTKQDLLVLHAATQAEIAQVWAEIDLGAKGKAKKALLAKLTALEYQRNSLDFLIACK